MSEVSNDWLLVNHLDSDGLGTLTTVTAEGDKYSTKRLSATTKSGKIHSPWFLGLLENQQVILFDPEHKTINLADEIPQDAYPAYSYKDMINNRIWFMNDGDKDHGNDALNCNNEGSTVTIIDMGDGASAPQHIKTLCVGSGHHVTTFIEPTREFPDLPKVAYVSNLLSGSICVVGNDENDSETYLNIIHTINLCEPNKEKDGNEGIPNNAFPHGKQLSYQTGKVYSLNNGYGTIAVINPATHEIESRINLKGCSNLLLSPCAKFLIGKGADRKSNPLHVLGRLSVIDVRGNKVLSEADMEDFYPSTYRFNPDGKKLYVTSAATGKGEQKANLKINTLYIYDVSQLPKLQLIKSMEVGNSDCGRRPIAFNQDDSANRVFIPNPTDATLTILDGETDTIIETIKIADQGGKEFNFSFWQNCVYGA